MVRFNKKGNAITEPMVFLSILVVVALLTLMFFTFSSQVATNSNSNLNDASILYIAQNNGFKIEDKSLDEEILTQAQLESSFYAKDDNTSTSDKDDALEFLFYREQSIAWRNLINSAYNLPSYCIGVFGLDLSDWLPVLHAANLFIWAIIFFIIYKIIRGLIK